MFSMNKLVNKYGEPLNSASDFYKFAYYTDCAHNAENELPETVTIGKTATGAYLVNNAAVVVQLSMLNESFGLMPDHGDGNLVGDISVTTREVPDKSEDPLLPSILSLDFNLYASGKVELSYAERHTNDTDVREVYTQAGAHPLKLKEQKHLLQPNILNHAYEELSYEQNRFLKSEQLARLNAFVVGAFVELS